MRDEIDGLRDERDRLTERVAGLVTEGNELRGLLGEILDAVEATSDRAGMRANISHLAPKRAGIMPAVVTAGTEHLAADVRDRAGREDS